jgi:hypothetical protein
VPLSIFPARTALSLQMLRRYKNLFSLLIRRVSNRVTEGKNVVNLPHKLTMLGVLLLSGSAIALAGPKTTTAKKHAHATTKATSVRSAKLIHVKGSRATTHHEMSIPAMPSERAAEIQTALIQKGYLSGAPTGTWDAQTIAAMQKLQGDNGWQTKITPDSRALIKLGLGPQPATQAPDTSQDIAQASAH